MYAKGTVVCVAFAHVDDMILGVHPSSPPAQRMFEDLQAARKWVSLEVNVFVQTGILITQVADKSILQSFQRASQKVTMIEGWQKPTTGR